LIPYYGLRPYGESPKNHQFLELALDALPDAIIDDGADMVTILHKDRREQAKPLLAGVKKPQQVSFGCAPWMKTRLCYSR
jgi:S-adenosylhomocysteine hydrolase